MPQVIAWSVAMIASFGALALHMQTFDGGSWRWHVTGAALLTLTLCICVTVVGAIEDWAYEAAKEDRHAAKER